MNLSIVNRCGRAIKTTNKKHKFGNNRSYGVENRLLKEQQKTKISHNKSKIRKIRKEQAELKINTPMLSENTKNLVSKMKKRQPLYSIGKLSKIFDRKKSTINVDMNNYCKTPKFKASEKREFSFSPESRTNSTKRNSFSRRLNYIETSEDRELRMNCTFFPNMSKKSKEILLRREYNFSHTYIKDNDELDDSQQVTNEKEFLNSVIVRIRVSP